ncbi:hypothetical protein BDR07DRAFT_1389075 [Suillus spraguei]|nr:hypothetical protein BDR07DRAFT_1389075 [Suillus spraguei]
MLAEARSDSTTLKQMLQTASSIRWLTVSLMFDLLPIWPIRVIGFWGKHVCPKFYLHLSQ